jgi:hypothetical protein
MENNGYNFSFITRIQFVIRLRRIAFGGSALKNELKLE